ncbi:MAG: CCA tRNA nucleotidyltransferase [Candidatus Aenigmarchaeota archaeon]|nr:CCA tRNA nucleotidyltransferase [Candidatus Aenigmarchaeota archaeon]
MAGKLEEEILKKIRPSAQEEEQVKKFAGNLLRVAKTVSGLGCSICGSIGKFTWLRGDHDIDLFIVFPKTTSRDELEEKGLEFGKKIVSEMRGGYILKYAEHPYVHASIDGYTVDIVPCYRIKKGEPIISAVDRSLLHLEYVLESLDEKKRDEVRLLKQFCKGISVYGSDARHLGFSGYICELLVIKFGGFMKVLKEAAKWAAPKLITFDGSAGGSAKNFGEPFVIVDPADRKRNVAANLSGENFIKFVSKCRQFLKEPSETYFFPKHRSLSDEEIKELKDRGTVIFAIVMEKPNIIDDILYPQLRKTIDRIETQLKQNEFVVDRSYEYVKDRIALFFELGIWDLPSTKKMTGPKISSRKHAAEFKSKYKNAYVEGQLWMADKKRDFRKASEFVKDFLAKDRDYLVSRGIPENIAGLFLKARFLQGEEFWEFVRENEGFSAFLMEKYFEKL